MPWLDIAVACGQAATVVIAATTSRRSPVHVVTAASITFLLLAIALYAEGPRWQLLLLALLFPLVGGIAAWLRSRRRKGLARTSAVIACVTIAAVATASWALPPLLVPAPSGPQAVGMTTMIWTDATRDAYGERTGGGERSIPGTIWYPASEQGTGSRYIPDEAEANALTSALSSQYGLPSLLFDSLARGHTNADMSAPTSAGHFPVVIASPGAGSSRWLMTSWAEEVTSHGFIVVALDHPYDSAAVTLSDGTLAQSTLAATGNEEQDQAAADHAAAIRADDIRAVIDHLESRDDEIEALSYVDVSMIIAAGHSLGGAAALEAARTDPRIDGVIDIDGMPRSPEHDLHAPALFLVAGDADENPGYSEAISGYLEADDATRVTIPHLAHLGFVDAGLVLAPIPSLTGLSGRDGPRLTARASVLFIRALQNDGPVNKEALGEIGSVG